MNIKRLMLLSVLVIVVLVTFSGERTGAPVAQAQGSTIRFPLGFDPGSLDMLETGYNQNATFVVNQIYENMFRYAPDGTLLFAGAVSYEIDESGTEYTIELRPEAEWSDEQPVYAQHYVDGILRLGGTDLAYLFFPISGFEEWSAGTRDPEDVGLIAFDDYTIKMTLTEPTSHMIHIFASEWIRFPVRLDGTSDPLGPILDNYVSNGPYELVEWVPEDHVTLVKSSTYWNAASVEIENIYAPIMPDLNDQLDAYRNNQLDVSLFPGSENSTILGDPLLSAELRQFTRPGVYYIGLNTALSPADDVNFRRALATSIDREYLLETVLNNPWTSKATGVISPTMLGYQGSAVGHSFDRVAAADYLSLVTSNPSSITIEVWYNTSHSVIFNAVAQMWESNLGINVNLVEYDWSVYFDELGACRSDPLTCAYHGYRLGWVPDYLDPWNMLNDAFHPDSYANYTHWDSEPYRNYLDLAKGETDEGIRIGYFQDAERILVGDPAGVEGDVVVIPLYYYSRVVLIKSNIKFEYAGTGTAPYIMNWSFKNQPTFIVNSTEDPGIPGDDELTLREAIHAANANQAIDAIHFDIPGGGIHTIQPVSPLPTITDPVRIDGTTQPGYSDEPIIVLDGSNWGAIGNGLHITGGDTVVSSLIINSFTGNGIQIDGNGSNTIEKSYVGTGHSPTVALGNIGAGVEINDSSDNVIIDNIIAYNASGGVLVNDVTAPSGDTIRNSIRLNSIYDNLGKGIENLNGGNTELEPPVITTMLEDSIVGTAPPNTKVVEIFADGNGEGRTWLGTANPISGNFTFPGPLSGPNLTATATDFDGNTSEFSVPILWAPDNCEFNDGFNGACDLATELGFSIGSEGSFESFISHAGDVDWFYFDLPVSVPPGTQVSINLTGDDGGELPANFDLAVLAELGNEPGTPATPLEGVDLQVVPLEGVPLEGVPLEGVDAQAVDPEGVPLEGVLVEDIDLQEVPLEGVPLEGVPLEGVPLEGVPLEGVGFHQGTQPEEVTTLFRGGMTGRYYVMVWSSTGEYSTSPTESPYKVTVTTSGVTADACVTGVDPGLAAIGPLTTPGNTTDPSTLILINRPRMEDLYGVVETGDLITSLRGLNGHSTVNGLIVDLGSDEDIMEAYSNWDNFGCSPEAANLVTIEIKDLINSKFDTYPSMENLVLVGNDMVIPFRRVPDEVVRTPDGATVPNEFDYQNELEIAGQTINAIGQTGSRYSPTIATLRLQYYLSDDFYADLAPVLLDHGHELSVPDVPIGRLVETPQDIQAYIEGFLDHEGDMGTGAGLSITSLTTGYSFLQDQATEILEILTDPGGKNFGAVNDPSDSLVNDVWSLNHLLGAYLPELPGVAPWIASINAHFDHSRAAPADFLTLDPPGSGDLLSTADVSAAAPDLSGSLLFTVGCHSGMNFVDGDVLAGYEAGMLDWPQVMISRGASLIGNWGYGYGDDAMIAYSEELMVNFARNLGVGNIGQALVDAKRQYLLNQAVLDPVHEKILMESVLYGLPMWQLTAPVPEIPTGVDVTPTTGSQHGLDVTEYAVEVIESQPEAIPVTERGMYYAVEGQTQAALYRPVQPQTSIDVGGVPGQVAHGAIFKSGTYYLADPDGDGETDDFDPVITMPSWTRTNPEPQFLYEGWDPAKFWSLAQLELGDGSYEERLVVMTGQFLVDEAETLASGSTIGTQRLYNSFDFEVFYASVNDEFQPPIIKNVSAGVSSNPGVFISIQVADPGSTDPQFGIVTVVVTYTEKEGGTTWQSVELVFNTESGHWEGTLQTPESINFFVQALDESGNVGMFAGNGYFTPVEVNIGGPSATVVGQSASFTVTEPAGLSEPNYVWDFGDGIVMKGPASVDHTYSETGEFSVQVKLVDAAGNLGEAVTDITIEPTPSTIPDFIHYCVYANEDVIQIEERAHVMCNVGGEEGIKLEKRSEVDGNVVGRDDISIESRAYVGGDVIAAGKVILNRRANVEGEVIRGADIPPLPRVELSVSAGGSDFTVPKEQTRSLFPGTYKLLKVEEDATLVLSAGHYIFEKIEVEENATILFELAYGRQVIIDVADTVDMKEGVIMVTDPGSASDIIFRVAGSDVKLGKAGTFLGTFIAPEAHIDLHERAELTGALHGRKVQINKEAIVHGDPALNLIWDLFTQ